MYLFRYIGKALRFQEDLNTNMHYSQNSDILIIQYIS